MTRIVPRALGRKSGDKREDAVVIRGGSKEKRRAGRGLAWLVRLFVFRKIDGQSNELIAAAGQFSITRPKNGKLGRNPGITGNKGCMCTYHLRPQMSASGLSTVFV